MKTFTDPLQLIVKVSHSQFALEDELERRPVPGSFYSSRTVLPTVYTVAGTTDLFAVRPRRLPKRPC